MQKLGEQQFHRTVERETTIENIEVAQDLGVRLDGYAKIFKNCHFKNWAFESRVTILEFHDCTFNTLMIVLNHAQNIIIENCTADEVTLTGAKEVLVSEIQITGSTTKIGDLKIDGGFSGRKILFDGVTGLKKASLQLNCSTLDVHNSEGIDYLVMFGEIKRQIDFKNCRDMKFIKVRDIKAERMEFSDSNDLQVYFEATDTKYINFNRCISTSIETTYLKAENLGLNVGTYKKVLFYHDCDFNFSATPITDELTIDNLTFHGAKPRKDRTLKIESAKVKELVFDALHNDAVIQFLNCEISNQLTIYRSNLGKFQFTNVELDESCRIDLLDSNISDVHFNSFKWNRRYKLFETFDPYNQVRYETQNNFLHSLRESYRQLKANYLKNGNKIEALEFQRGELDVHLKILHKKRFSFRNIGNYLIVATNKWFSDFGQNIWKPLFFLFGFHLLIFNFIVYQNPDIDFDIGWPIDWNETQKASSLYFQTLLPTHSTEIRFDNRSISIGGFLDFIARICSGYFIFYFISASRKYHQ